MKLMRWAGWKANTLPPPSKTQFPAKQSNMWCATCNVILNVMVESKVIDPSLSNDNPSRPTTS